MYKTQIIEHMCLETHFQYDFPILRPFGQLGLQTKKNPNCHKYATFTASFFMFLWTKNDFKIFLKYPSIGIDIKLRKMEIFP